MVRLPCNAATKNAGTPKNSEHKNSPNHKFIALLRSNLLYLWVGEEYEEATFCFSATTHNSLWLPIRSRKLNLDHLAQSLEHRISAKKSAPPSLLVAQQPRVFTELYYAPNYPLRLPLEPSSIPAYQPKASRTPNSAQLSTFRAKKPLKISFFNLTSRLANP